MKRKRKDTCHALEFAKQLYTDKPWIHDLKECDAEFRKSFRRLKQKGFAGEEKDTEALSRISFTANRWLANKQCYSITETLADDLFAMDDLSFPMDALHLPFPCFYLDMEPFGEDMGGGEEGKLLGYYVMVDEVPYGEGVYACCCSIVVLGLQENGEYLYGGTAFDYAPEHMEMDLKETVQVMSQSMPENMRHITRALLFAAYLSSDQPEVVEDEAQKRIYRPSAKPKYSSVRKWDTGVRYMQEKQAHAARQTSGADAQDGPKSSGKARRNPPRPHMRKAHWHPYRIGHGRTGRKILWIPPVMVGVPKGNKKEDIPAVIRERKEKKKQ